MVLTVEMYRDIRRLRLEGHSQRWIAGKLGISRNTVKKYWDGDNVLWRRKGYERSASVLTPEVEQFIQNCLL